MNYSLGFHTSICNFEFARILVLVECSPESIVMLLVTWNLLLVNENNGFAFIELLHAIISQNSFVMLERRNLLKSMPVHHIQRSMRVHRKLV